MTTATIPSTGVSGVDILVTQGEVTSTLAATLLDGEGSAVNLTGSTVQIAFRKACTATSETPDILDPVALVVAANGTVLYTWSTRASREAGFFDKTQFIVTTADGVVTEYPSTTFLRAQVVQSVDTTDEELDDLAATTGAALIGIVDAAGKIVGTNVETALAEVAAVTSRRGVASLTIGHADLTAVDTEQEFPFAAPLPTGAVVLATFAIYASVFTDATDADTTEYVMGTVESPAFVFGSASAAAVGHVAPSLSRFLGFHGAVTPKVTVILTAGTTLDLLTKGSATFYVIYEDYTTP
jgi:hypothetical protein